MKEESLLNDDDLQITPGIKLILSETARWGKFLSVVGLILSGLIVVMGFALPSIINNLNPYQNTELLPESSRLGITVNFLIIAMLVFIPCLFLLKFSRRMENALEEINQDSFLIAFSNLKMLLKFYGIITIVIIALYGLGILMYVIATYLGS